MQFTFGSPYFLLFLLLLPCFLWCKPYNRLYYFPKLEWISKQTPLLSWEPWLKMLIFSLLLLALSKPFVYDASNSEHKKGRDLILAIDASGSMAQSGFDKKDRFKNKYETTLTLSNAFTKKRFDDNMGVVVFGTFAYTASPLTYDLEALSFLLEMTTVGLAGESTAIGDAIMQSIRTLSFGEAENKAIILLTDGYHNAGRTSPKESGGKSYSASSAEALSKVYQEIDTLEPSPIRSENYLNQKILIFFPLALVFLLLFLWIIQQKRSES